MNRTVRAMLIGVLTALSTMLTVYALFVRRWILRWGASDAEVQRELPGDRFVTRPHYQATRAVTINAAPEEVWPWLLQMGQGRGGLYSYDWLENLVGCDIHSAATILPEYQDVAIGDKVRLVPEGTTPELALEVALLEPQHAFVLRTLGDPLEAFQKGLAVASWAFVLEPVDAGNTRLLVRWRSYYKRTLAGALVNQYALEPIHFFMERKQLLGIKERAERLAQQRTTTL